MPENLTCPSCGATLRLPGGGSSKVRCGACGSVFHPSSPADRVPIGTPAPPESRAQVVVTALRPQQTSVLALASLVLGIVGVVSYWLYGVGWLLSLLAVILGHLAIRKCDEDPQLRGKGMAIASVFMGGIFMGLYLLNLVIGAAGAR